MDTFEFDGSPLSDTDKRLARIEAMVSEMVAPIRAGAGTRLDAVERRLQSAAAKLELDSAALDSHERRLATLDEKMHAIAREHDALAAGVSARLDALEARAPVERVHAQNIETRTIGDWPDNVRLHNVDPFENPPHHADRGASIEGADTRAKMELATFPTLTPDVANIHGPVELYPDTRADGEKHASKASAFQPITLMVCGTCMARAETMEEIEHKPGCAEASDIEWCGPDEIKHVMFAGGLTQYADGKVTTEGATKLERRPLEDDGLGWPSPTVDKRRESRRPWWKPWARR